MNLRRPTGTTCLRTPQIDSLTWVPHGVLNSVVGCGSSCKADTPSFPLPKRLSSSRGVSYRLSFVVVGLSISILKRNSKIDRHSIRTEHTDGTMIQSL